MKRMAALSAQRYSVLLRGMQDVGGVDLAASLAVPPFVSSSPFALGGAGTRGLEINGHFINFTSIAIYLEEGIFPYLHETLQGKTLKDLCHKELLFEEILAAPYTKIAQINFLVPLTGEQYSQKVLERINVRNLYTKLEENSKSHFLEVFKGQKFPPGSSILLYFSEDGLKVYFCKDNKPFEGESAIIEDKILSKAILTTIIWKDSVSLDTKMSLTQRMFKCFEAYDKLN